MADNSILYQALMQRGLFEPDWALKEGDTDPIADDEVLLSKVAAIDEIALQALIKGRIKMLAKELMFDAHPAETVVFRQVIWELASVLDEQTKYSAEKKRRDDAAKEAGEGNQTGDNASNGAAEDNGTPGL